MSRGISKNRARADLPLVYQRLCPSCGEVKTVNLEDQDKSEYYLRKNSGANGRRGAYPLRPEAYCKTCKSERAKDRDPEAKREAKRKYAANNRDAINARRREIRAVKRSQIAAQVPMMVPIQPFAEWLQQFYHRHAEEQVLVEGKIGRYKMRYGREWIANVMELDEKYVEDLLRGRRWRNQIDIVKIDALLTRLDLTHLVSILYPAPCDDGDS